MRIITPAQHQERVEAVMEVIRGVTGQASLPETVRTSLMAMSFEELGMLAVRIVEKRSVDLPGTLPA